MMISEILADTVTAPPNVSSSVLSPGSVVLSPGSAVLVSFLQGSGATYGH